MQLLYLFVIMLLLAACQSSTSVEKEYDSHIQDSKVKTILQQAIAKAGGWTHWAHKEGVAFKKYFALYDSLGNTEQAVWQDHVYTYQPQQTVTIRWEKANEQHRMVFQKEGVQKFVNNQLDTTANPTSLRNSVLAATFVAELPFRLLDASATLTYAGKTTIEDSIAVETIRATYEGSINPDVWHIYFDAKDYKMVGYTVQHLDHISYVINESYTEIGGFLYPHKRKSYRVNEAGDKLYLRAAYEYLPQ